MKTGFERNLVINNKELKYSGIFNPNDIFNAINKALKSKGYEKREKKTEELVSSEQRANCIELRPIKVKSEIASLMIKIKIRYKNTKETVKEVNGVKRKFLQGDISIVFDAWVLTDFEHHIMMNPMIYFLRAFVNKFIHKISFQANLTSEVMEDTAFIYGQLKKLFKEYDGKIEEKIKEEEVRKRVEEEMENNVK